MPEIRDPLYGMVHLTRLEWEVVNSVPFQRLRRIRQLAFSDYVYPGAVHTRFEHSIGMMHLASQAFERVVAKREARDALASLGYDDAMYQCARAAVRLASLVHDLGHLPFSHAAAEDIMPEKSADGGACTHEDYSVALVRKYLSDPISNHPDNASINLTAEDVVAFYRGRTDTPRLAKLAPWRALIVGELDADRMDYLRRDSYHLGVQYGQFDVERVVSTLTLAPGESGQPRLAVEEGGLLAVESLIVARYYMFCQVYYHKVRRYLDHLYSHALKQFLAREGRTSLSGPEDSGALEDFVLLDDWSMQSALRDLARSGSAEATDLLERRPMKVLFEIDGPDKAALMEEAEKRLRKTGIRHWRDSGSVKATQTFRADDIRVVGETSFQGVRPISSKSRVAVAIPPRIYIERLYVPKDDRDRLTSEKWLARLMKKGEGTDERRSGKARKA